MMRKCLLLALLVALLCCAGMASAQGLSPESVVYEPAQSVAIRAQQAGDDTYLFLPANADLSALALSVEGATSLTFGAENGQSVTLGSGEPLDVTALVPTAPDDGKYHLTVAADGAEALSVTLMKSESIAALYLISSDPEKEGREWLEAGRARVQETTGSMALVNPDGSVVYNDQLRQIRGRGNTTWFWGDKKPYQIKLAQKTNLLETGDNRARTWLLVADAFDATHLRNAISLALAKELGLPGTPEYRFVNLYYDGEYRGLYLLCEKVEVDSARLAIENASDIIEELHPSIDDAELFPCVEGTDAQGLTYQYVSNVSHSFLADGAYLLELDQYNYTRAPSWFFATKNNPYEIHSPKYASEADVLWLRTFMREMEACVRAGGVHPENGKTLDEYIDMPSFARYMLVHQFAKTCDFGYTSTYMYIPKGEAKLYGGPVWDFDIAYAMRDTRPYETGVDGYLPPGSWLHGLLSVPAFQDVMRELFETELLPLLQNVLLADESAHGQTLMSLDGYLAYIEPSRRMNDVLWELGGHYNNIDHDTLFATYAENIDYLRNYLIGRTQWLTDDIAKWQGVSITRAELALSYINANITECATFVVDNPYYNCALQNPTWQSELVEDAPWHSTYTVSFTLATINGASFDESVEVYANGTKLNIASFDPNVLALSFSFEAPTFASAMYDDVDYGLLFNADYFALLHPEVVEDYGDNPEDLLIAYVDDYLYNGDSAIETFDFEWFITNYEHDMMRDYSLEPYTCTMHYLEYAYRDNLLAMEAPVVPEVMP